MRREAMMAKDALKSLSAGQAAIPQLEPGV
jgi:hypothetical protein